jgi:hypothetical protein
LAVFWTQRRKQAIREIAPNCSELLDLSEPYEAPVAGTQEVASLRGETSNQLLEILEEWNDYLER